MLVTALTVLVFSALTVEVDAEAIRLRFGIGLVRKRIPLAEVKAWRDVRNPWYTGWGIRLGSGYVLWNVSGLMPWSSISRAAGASAWGRTSRRRLCPRSSG